MKRIGIVTLYHKNYNYGGQMQAYAMQKVFSENGDHAELVAFQMPKAKSLAQRVFDLGLKKSVENIANKKKFKAMLKKDDGLMRSYRLKMERYEDFILSIPHTKVYDDKTIVESNDLFDMFVCGSDQVWNPGWWNEILFLKFTEKRKFSYAASIARVSLSDQEISYIKNNTADYFAISVREEQAQKMLEKVLEREIDLVLDPTLLVDEQHWNEICNPPKTNEKYVLFYMVGNFKGLKEKVYEICKKNGYKVYSIGFSKNTYFSADVQFTDRVITDAGPREWMGWIKNAEYVFTDSFHGSVFSIIFEKNFWCFERDDPKDKSNENSRLYSFLKLTGLENRLLEYNSEIDLNDDLESIDFKTVKEKLNVYREISRDFIKKCIN